MAISERHIGRRASPQVNTRGIVVAISIAFAGLLATAFGLAPFFSDRVGVTHVDSHPFPAPGVVVREGADRILLEKKQRAALQGAGNRMPIDEAMKAVVERGTRAFDPWGDRR